MARSGSGSDARPEGRAFESRPIRDVRLSSVAVSAEHRFILLSTLVSFVRACAGAFSGDRLCNTRKLACILNSTEFYCSVTRSSNYFNNLG